MSQEPAAIVQEWLSELTSTACREANASDDPNYYCHSPQELVTSCTPLSFELGTGAQIVQDIVQKCCAARSEVIIVTCFWAPSQSLDSVAGLLKSLSIKACNENIIIRVRVGFSSRSLVQKLFHTTSLYGENYGPSLWAEKLGLPPLNELPGLDLSVKSVFILPFSVMHPKFVIVDRRKAFLPSCNLSWEDWFEGCIEFEGELVTKLFYFWQEFWARNEPSSSQLPQPQYRDVDPDAEIANDEQLDSIAIEECSKNLLSIRKFNLPTIPALLLPSPHHQNPQFRPFTFTAASPPPTPLNTFLLRIFRTAKKSIYIQTPNVTSSPVLNAIYNALISGVDVHVITSSRLMLLEEIVTAGTITEFSIWLLRHRYRKYISSFKASNRDAEVQCPKPGNLTVEYYHPMEAAEVSDHEPVKSHLKLVIVDGNIVVLGSGNMDRASWYTSQELGVAFFSEEVARVVLNGVRESLRGRVEGNIITAQ